MGESLYDHGFFEGQAEGARRSAEIVLPLLFGLLDAEPLSVVDVGCGTGGWLGACQSLGIEDVLGIDGEYVPEEALTVPAESFLSHDLVRPLALDRSFDIVLAMEVAEHLPATAADTFIDTLVALGSIVLFSAAIPGQGGVNHVNEQWPAYWANRFEDRGFLSFDCIRPVIWNDDRIDYWYRQNSILYVRAGHAQNIPVGQLLYGGSVPHPLSLVHPVLLERVTRRRSRLLRAKKLAYKWTQPVLRWRKPAASSSVP